MKFKNLSFSRHPIIGDGSIQATMICNNGKRLSVVAGKSTYSHTTNGVSTIVEGEDVNNVTSFEVMIGNEVLGWQSRKNINDIIKKNS